MRYKLRRKLGVLAILASVVCGLQAIRYLRNDLAETSNKKTDRYVKAIYQPKTLDPAQANDVASISVINLIYSGLLEFGHDLSLRGDLAESWRTTSDGRTIFFKLKSNVKFHDGSPLTSENVIASLTRLMAADSRVYNYYEAIVGADDYHRGRTRLVKGLSRISDRDFLIRLRYPFPPFLSILAGATAKVLPVKSSARSLKNFFLFPIGCGPFKVKKIGAETIILTRFEEYHAQRPYISELVLDLSSQPVAMQKAISGNIHDLVSWTTTAGNEPVFKYGQHIGGPVAETWIVGLNTKKYPFNNVKIRRGFKEDFPSEEFRQRFYPDSEPAKGYVPPLLPGHLTAQDVAKLDLEWAGLAKQKSHQDISIAIIQGLNREGEMRAFIENDMRSKGWRVTVKPMPWEKLMASYNNKSLQAFIVSMNIDYPDPEFLFRNFHSKNIDNFSSINNKEVDRLILQARVTQDRIERERIYRALSFIIAKESVTVEFLYGRGHYWLHRCTRGLVPNLLSYVYIDYRLVYLDESCMRQETPEGEKT